MELEQRMDKISSDLKLLTWMVGFNLALTVTVFFLLINLTLQVGRLA
jgi:hypothetical protein